MHDSVPVPARDGQLRSPFRSILETLCDSCVGALGAALVDEEGENVDLSTSPMLDDDSGNIEQLQAYHIKLCGAHWQIVFRQAVAKQRLGGVQQLWICTSDHAYVLCRMVEGYVLLLICRPEALATVSRRALRQAQVEICREADWPVPDPDAPYWRRTRLRLNARGEPSALQFQVGKRIHGAGQRQGMRLHERWDTEVSCTGPVKEGLDGFEKGFRVVTPAGDDFMVVREPSGFWYASLHVPRRRAT